MEKRYTARFSRISTGYLGQLVDWPEVVTEGKDMEECREFLKDALNEMVAAYRDDGQELPEGALYEAMEVPA
jgi:predicted RNase H-like HicB family nuclease